jgi:hypothetical protein
MQANKAGTVRQEQYAARLGADTLTSSEQHRDKRAFLFAYTCLSLCLSNII